MLRLIKDAIPFTVYIIGFFSLITLWISGILLLMNLPTIATILLSILLTAFLGFVGHIFVNACSDWSID